MNLQDVLRSKGSAVYTIHAEATLQAALGEMLQRNVGSLLVQRQDAPPEEMPEGIITERDVLRACAAGGQVLATIRVGEAMTRELIFAAPEDDVAKTMSVMTRNRFRHVPVLSESRVVGMVSMRDMVKAQLDQLALENQLMRDYIRGER